MSHVPLIEKDSKKPALPIVPWLSWTTFPLDHPFGYVIAVAAMMTQMCIFGTGYALSTFIKAIEKDPQIGSGSDSLVALASGINYGMGPFVGCASGILSDRWGPRRIVMFAALCHASALLLASVATTPFEFVVAYGPLMGLAFGCMVTPGSHATASYFDHQRSVAMGVNYAGGGGGSALIPHVAALLLTHYEDTDWRPAMRWMALLALGCFFPALLLVKRPHEQSDTNTSKEVGDEGVVPASPVVPLRDALLSRRFFSLFFVAVFFGYSFYSSVFFWVPFARAQGKTPYEDRPIVPLEKATFVTICFGVAQAVGNVALGAVASAVDSNMAYMLSTLLASAAMLTWPWVTTFTELLVVAAVAGVGAAGARTILPSLVPNHFPDRVGTMMGFVFMGYGVGGLLGPPVTSAIVKRCNEDFTVALSVVGSSCVISGIVYFFAVPPVAVEVGSLRQQKAQLEVNSEAP